MSRSWLLYLDDLIASAEKIARLTKVHSQTTFAGDEAVFDAVLFNLQVIGEAVKHLPEEAKAALSEPHRRAPARLRDLIAHHYFAVDADIVWDVCQRHLPGLLQEALALRSSADARGS